MRRIRAVTNTHREVPPVNMGKSVDDFFRDVEKTTAEGSKLPNWFVILPRMLRLLIFLLFRHGELYLEVRKSNGCRMGYCLIHDSSTEAHTPLMVSNPSKYLRSPPQVCVSGSIKKGNRHSEILLRDVEVKTFIRSSIIY